MKPGIGRIILATLALAACQESAITAPEDGPDLHRSRDFDRERTYEITIENLTSGQPFSPGVIVTHRERTQRHWWKHRRGFRLFQPGRRASEGIRAIAENGDPSVAVTELTGASGVTAVVATAAPIHRIGGPGETSLTTTITTKGKASRLSLAVMLICTNDGFVGVRNARLPYGDHPVVTYARAYDAGTETNDELYNSIVPPCGAIGPVTFENGNNERTPENRKIRHHRGIRGVGDLDPVVHDWKRRVAKVTIRRVN